MHAYTRARGPCYARYALRERRATTESVATDFSFACPAWKQARPPLHIDVVERDGSLTLRVEGDLDLATAPLLDKEIERATASQAAMIVVDLDQVGFIDSSGLYVLVRHISRSRQDGRRIRLTKGSEQTQQLFKLTGVLDHLSFVDH